MMKFILRLLSWKATLVLSVVVLVSLNIFSFYGLYTNKFYFFKFDNYIFPLLSIVHYIYLYAIWFKMIEREDPDPQMRNLEYSLYLILLVYIYKAIESLITLLSYSDYESFALPETFLPIGKIIVGLYGTLLFITLLTFGHRKKSIGKYEFSNLNQNIDSW